MSHETHALICAAPSNGLLVEIAAGLATGSDLGALLGRFLQPIMRLAGAQAGAVRVLSGAGDQLELVSAVGLPDKLCGGSAVVDRHCGHCGAAADGQALVWASDLRSCSDRAGSDYFGQSCQRLLAVPLQHRGRTLGVYNLFFASSDQAPSAEVEALLSTVGELLGLALNNSRLEKERLRTTLLQERQAMAADVHDSIAQSLAFMKMRMPLLQDAMLAHDDHRALRYCDDVRQALTQAHASLRGIITQLRAPMDPQGMVHALGAAADNFRRSTGTELDFINDLPGLQLPPEQEAQLFHIVQEALNNVARHAGSQHAWLYIGPVDETQIQILVDDDGNGLPADRTGSSHFGMEIMLDRARRLGGKLEVGPRHGGGTRVHLTFPVVQAAAHTARQTTGGVH